MATAVGRGPAPALRRARRRRTAARALLGAAVVGLLLLGAALYVGWRVQQVAGHLRSAADRAPALAGQLAVLDVEGARGTAAGMRGETAAAVALTDDPLWRLAQRFPWGGQNLAAAAAGARAADGLAVQGAGGAVSAAQAVVDLRARVRSLDLDPAAVRDDLARARDGAALAAGSAATARQELRGLDRRYLLPPVASALDRVEAAAVTVEALQEGLRSPLAALGLR